MIIFLCAIIAICFDILSGRKIDDRYLFYLVAGSAELIFFDSFVMLFLGV